MAYNTNKGPQHVGDIQYEGDPNDTQIDFEDDSIALKTNAQQRFIVTGSAITGSTYRLVFKPEELPDAFRITAGSTDNDDNVFRIDTDSLYFHTAAGYKWRIGSDTVAPTHTISVTGDISGSGTLHADGATTIANTLATTGSITAGTTITAGSGLVGNTLDIGGSDLVVTAAGNLSGSGTLTCTSLSASGESHFSGNVGIGTANPSSDLHVNGAGVTVVTIDGGAGSDAYLRFNTNAVEKAFIKQGSGGNTIIANEVASKNLQLQARAAAGSATTYLFLDGGSESVLVAKPVSASSTLHHVGVATFSSTVSSTGSISSSASLIGNVLNIGQSDYLVTSAGNVSGSGTLQVVSSTILGASLHVSGACTVAGDILPAGDNTANLGSGAKRWANVYTADLHLRNDRGNWTVIEEEDYLSIVNNKNGKKYKFVLEEIED